MWPEGTFTRIQGSALNAPHAVLSLTLGVVGGSDVARGLGFARIAAHDGPFEPPILRGFVGDARDDHELAVHSLRSDQELGPMFFVATFPDPHPPEWRGRLHQEGELLLLATPQPVLAYPKMADALKVGWIAMLPLAVFLFGDALGTVCCRHEWRL